MDRDSRPDFRASIRGPLPKARVVRGQFSTGFYGLALFSLGGIYWNHGPGEEALRIWSDAIERFPEHELADVLRRGFANYFE